MLPVHLRIVIMFKFLKENKLKENKNVHLKDL